MLNGNASHSRVMSGNGTRHDIPNHPPMIGHMRVAMGSSRLRQAVRNVGMTELLMEVVTTAIKKGMIEEILREPSRTPLRRRCRKARNRVGRVSLALALSPPTTSGANFFKQSLSTADMSRVGGGGLP